MAVAAYGQAISFEPENIDALINRALVYSTLGEYSSTIADMDHVIEVDPTYAKAYLVRASAHANLGMAPKFQADIDRAVALGVDQAQAESNIAGTTPSP
jgi:Tfp pilus assembly protein PilF